MAIYEQGPRKGWTTVYNSVARDPRLSLSARGLFLTMESLPDNWRYSETGLCTVCQCGRTKLRSALAELQEAGYLTRTAQREGGRFAGEVYRLEQESTRPMDPEPLSDFTTTKNEPPLSHFPTAENPLSENQRVKNKDIKKERNTHTAGTADSVSDQLFARFWALYPKKRKKQDALKAWRQLAPDMDLCRTMSAALKVQMRSAEWQRDGGQYVPYPASWIRGRRWEDDFSGGAPVGFDEVPPVPDNPEDYL